MGREKQTETNQSQVTYAKSPDELKEIERLNRIGEATEAEQIAMNKAAIGDVTSLLRGQDLPGYLQQLPYGISEPVIGSITKYALRDVNNQLAQSGVGSAMESGATQQAMLRASADIRNQSAQYNLNNLMQLLNVGVGGQAQVQQPMVGYSSQLAGLTRGTGTTSGLSNQSKYFMNPFLKSAQTNAGAGWGTWMSSGF